MSDNDTNDTIRREVPTRRDTIKYGGAVVGSGLLAGCTGNSDSGSTPTETSTDESTETETATPEDESYSVTMSPVGEVTFEAVPETAVTNLWFCADTLISFGEGARLTGMRTPETQIVSHYDQLPGVEFDVGQLAEFEVSNKEQYYELNPDIFHVDPVYLLRWFDGWDEEDIEEITENVAPFFMNGKSSYGTADIPEGWDRELYTIEELTKKLAQVYKSGEKAQALIDVRHELVTEIQASLPPADKRPTVAQVIVQEGEIYPYLFNGPSYGRAHLRPLGARDAFANLDAASKSGATIDMETLLQYDPDVLIFQGGIGYWFDEYEVAKTEFENDSVGQKLAAIENGRFYRGGTFDQGLLLSLFQLEMAAKQFYPDQFGEWPGFDEQLVLPVIPEDEQLFDRQRVSDIINGDI